MAISLELEVPIGRPTAQVFAQLIDVERWPEWLIASGIVRVERLDAGPLAKGSLLRIEQRVAGRASTLDASVSALEAPTAFGVAGKDADGISIEIGATLLADGPTTRLQWRLKIGLPLRYRMFESMASPQVRRAAALDLEAFRQRLESVAEA
jgi:Polyketide cyclase / dehydrase and lipid transport